jgi:hypothetical protein
MGLLDPEPVNQQYITLHEEPQCKCGLLFDVDTS